MPEAAPFRVHELASAIESIQKELQERILDSATDYAIIAMNRSGRVTRWSAGAERVLGWREEEMLGASTHRFFTPEDRAARRPEIEMGLALERGSAPDERWHVRNGGERFWASGEMMLLRTAHGEIRGFLKILRDRTRQRADEAERNATELRFRSLVEVSPQVVWFGDAAGNITYCNAHWYEFTGLTPGDAGGDAWIDAIHPDHRERVLGVWADAIAAEDDWIGDSEVGDARAGRLVSPDEGAHDDTDDQAWGRDVGVDGGAASAEEAAVHIIGSGEDDA